MSKKKKRKRKGKKIHPIHKATDKVLTKKNAIIAVAAWLIPSPIQ